MPDNLPQHHPERVKADDEIDLLEVVRTLWDRKWTIIGITVFISSVAIVMLLQMSSSFVATTIIKPIATVDEDAYSESNAMDFFVLDKEYLLTAFVEYLEDRSVFVEATKKFRLIDQEGFSSQEDYEVAVREFVETFRLLPPVNIDGRERGVSRRNWELVAEYDDRGAWLQVLRYVSDAANAEIAEILRKRFTLEVNLAEQERDFDLKDLATKIRNVEEDYDLEMAEYETRLAFDLEDTSTKIDNALVEYDRVTSDRLAFLREQAAIARELGVAKNTIEAQTFSAQSSILASIDIDTPFYLRGYEAIEKEIELMESREDKSAFVSGLFELEKTKRQIEQNQTLKRAAQEKQFLDAKIELEAQMRAIEQDQNIERVKNLFETTPAWTGEGFKAAVFRPEATVFNSKISKLKMLILVGLLSGVLSCIYVLVASALRKREVSES
jgi:LPS O-antigen subunit length determinant protein (WzzB/FepE family)